MTDSTGQVAGETGREWRPIGNSTIAAGTAIVQCKAVTQEERTATRDRIIADHNRASLLTEALAALNGISKTFNSIRVLAEQHAGLTAACSCTQWDIVGEWCREELALIAKLSQEGKP